MNSFYLGHINYSSDLAEHFTFEPVWKTCMRTIVCFDEPQLSHVQTKARLHGIDLEILKDAEAYQYLLEVICGLKSEITGETQVLGQFKTFLAEMEKSHQTFFLNHYTLFQSLLQDCKELREKHIQNWGGSSYGSLTRRMIETVSHVAVLGNGQLAQSLLPWMKEKTVSVHGRNPRNNEERTLDISAFKNDLDFNNRSLVIAAPVPNCFITELVAQVNFAQIIDWRTEASLEAAQLPAGVNYHSFSGLTAFMESEKAKRDQHLNVLKDILQQKTDKFANRKQLRPQGWEDLC
jgi:glutamyl-tRNA reductase